MDDSFQDYLLKLQNKLASGNTIDHFLDYEVFNLIKSAESGMNADNIAIQLDVESIIAATLSRLADEGILTKIGDQYVIPRKVMGQIPGMPTPSISKVVVEDVNEIEDKEENSETIVSSHDDIFSKLDEKTISVKKKEKEFNFTPNESGSRASLRERAFKSTGEPSTSISDDLDMDSLLDDALGESIEEFVSDFSDISIEETKAESGLILPLVELLIETGYLQSQDEADQSAEYRLMQTVLENYPISSEDLEQAVNIESLSLMLSNLKADNLVDQTNDYRYTITKKVYKKLKDFIGSTESEKNVDLDRKIFDQYIEQSRLQFLEACLKLSYIDKLGQDEQSYNKMPEYEVLRLIKEYEPVSSENLKNLVNETLPVVVSRMLSKLHADGVVTTDMNNNYSTTTKLYYFMVRDRLKADLDEDSFEDYQQKYE